MAEPQFDARENFCCIEMDKSTTYIVVEGHEVDVYDSVLRGILGQKHTHNSDFVVVSGSDKKTILEFNRETSAKNFYIILDRDFSDIDENTPRVSTLSRYSIENYCFDTMVVRRALARVHGKSISTIEYESSTLLDYYKDEFTELLQTIIFYQKHAENREISWSDYSVLQKDCWKANKEMCLKLISDLRSIITENTNTIETESFAKLFPGKMIISGVYYYVKNELKTPKLSKTYNNYKSFIGGLLSALDFSRDFCDDLNPAIEFIKSRHGVVTQG